MVVTSSLNVISTDQLGIRVAVREAFLLSAPMPLNVQQSPNFKTFIEPKNQFQGINSASLCSLAGRYDNPISYSVPSPHRLFKNSSTGFYRHIF
jgi:hypothetical protein